MCGILRIVDVGDLDDPSLLERVGLLPQRLEPRFRVLLAHRPQQLDERIVRLRGRVAEGVVQRVLVQEVVHQRIERHRGRVARLHREVELGERPRAAVAIADRRLISFVNDGAFVDARALELVRDLDLPVEVLLHAEAEVQPDRIGFPLLREGDVGRAHLLPFWRLRDRARERRRAAGSSRPLPDSCVMIVR